VSEGRKSPRKKAKNRAERRLLEETVYEKYVQAFKEKIAL